MGEAPVSAAPEGGAAGLDALLATKLHIPRARDGLVPRRAILGRGRYGRLSHWHAPTLAGRYACTPIVEAPVCPGMPEPAGAALCSARQFRQLGVGSGGARQRP